MVASTSLTLFFCKIGPIGCFGLNGFACSLFLLLLFVFAFGCIDRPSIA